MKEINTVLSLSILVKTKDKVQFKKWLEIRLSENFFKLFENTEK